MEPKRGDEKKSEHYVRRYYDSKWDYIETDQGEKIWRDKENHRSYLSDSSVWGGLINNFIGSSTDKFDSNTDDQMWDDE